MRSDTPPRYAMVALRRSCVCVCAGVFMSSF
ncbi:hypothetical protein T12_6948 [Trichinella patagoniensis]|uniref:Uncharacterized protein n=1 Tax=Trichinella patagoniensis TaxID=990121 RepID=A0A0V0UKV3_9BILA|nr:hypothetical protein T12_6948 [Trichinella patagoniensis]